MWQRVLCWSPSWHFQWVDSAEQLQMVVSIFGVSIGVVAAGTAGGLGVAGATGAAAGAAGIGLTGNNQMRTLV